MDRYLRLLLRMASITLGYAAAMVAAGIALVLFTRVVTPSQVGQLADTGFDFGLVLGAVALGSLAGYVAFFPAILIILFAEFTKRRGWLFYTVAGGIIAAALPYAARSITGPEPSGAADFAVMSLAAGMIGGAVYWLIAGRGAGNWLPSAQGDMRTHG